MRPESHRFIDLVEIGHGARGVVYRAHDTELGVDVALKTLPELTPAGVAELKNEFRSLLGISHPNLVQFHELFADGRDAFFTMDLVQGVDFCEWVRRDLEPREVVPPDDFQRFRLAAKQLIEGVAAVHDAGTLHRDIKPSNVLVSHSGHVTVLDFGLAQTLRPDTRFAEDSDDIAGTLAYMAPELLLGERASAASDWFSVGVVFFQALSGLIPAKILAAPHESGGEGSNGVTRKATPLSLANIGASERFQAAATAAFSDLDQDVSQLILRLLSPDPNSRPEVEEIRSILGSRDEARSSSHTLAGNAPFVGRSRDLRELEDALAAARHGDPVVLRLCGPSGIGKSELVRRFIRDIEAQDTLVFHSRCHHQETLPYKAFDGLVEQICRFLRERSPLECEGFLPRHLPELAKLFPIVSTLFAAAARPAEAVENTEPHEIRRRAFNALRDLLRRLSDRYALVLWMDDIQWTDEDSALLLREILRPPDPPPALFLLSFRSEDRSLVEKLTAITQIERVNLRDLELAPLSAEDARDLVTQYVPPAVADAEEVRALLSEAAGSPFLIGQLAFYAKRLTGVDARFHVARLGDILSERLGELGAAERSLIDIVAIAGQPLPRDLALEASGLAPGARPLATRLESQALLRSTTLDDGSALEMYHDRLREAVLGCMDAEKRRAGHLALARAAESRSTTDPNFLYEHYKGAELRQPAGEWALRAAQQADDSLAFLEAARLYGEAAALLPEEIQVDAEPTIKRADALVNAGHCASAAEIYASVAATVSPERRLALRQRASEQFLVSGHIDAGVRELRALCPELGLRYPRSPLSAFAGLIARLLRLRVRGLGFKPPRGALSQKAQTAIDLCDSAGKGLVVVDPMRGLYFALMSLVLALREGDSHRIARGLCMGGAALSAIPQLAVWGRSMIDLAHEIGERENEPYMKGLSELALGQALIVERDWKGVLGACDHGAQVLKEGARGTTWERNVGRMGALRALEELGQIDEFKRRARELLLQAEDQGDRYAQVGARQNLAYWMIVENDLEGARRAEEAAMRLWTQSGYHIQHFYDLRFRAACCIYEGDPAPAVEMISAEWKRIVAANLLRHPTIRVDALQLRARAAIALASHLSSADRKTLLASAKSDARDILRDKRRDVVGHVRLLEAAIACLTGDLAAAREAIDDAHGEYQYNGRTLSALAAQFWSYRLHERPGDTPLMKLREQGIAEPLRWLDLVSPGFRQTVEN